MDDAQNRKLLEMANRHERDKRHGFIGVVAILALPSLLFALAMLAVTQLALILHQSGGGAGSLEMLAPATAWIAEHRKALQIALSVICMLAVLATPPILMFRDLDDGGDRLPTIGRVVTSRWFLFAMANLALAVWLLS